MQRTLAVSQRYLLKVHIDKILCLFMSNLCYTIGIQNITIEVHNMYKKILLVLLGCMLISSVCLAGTNVRCEIESDNAVTYYVDDTNSAGGARFHKTFTKYVDSMGNEEYWLRLSSTTGDRMMYYTNLLIGDSESKVNCLDELKIKHLCSAEDFRPYPYELCSKGYYPFSGSMIKALLDTDNFVIYANLQTKQGIKLNSSGEFLDKVKTIIGLTYADRDKYWQPNIVK